MTALAAGDAERVLRFVADAEELGGDQPFTGNLLVELGQVIEADWVTYTEVDHVGRRVLAYVPRPGDEDNDEVEIPDGGWDLMGEHPICRRWRESGRFAALRLSDVVTRRELHKNRFYHDALRLWGVEYELKVRLASPPWHAKTFLFSRKIGRDFTQRDRLVLDLLTPHFTRLWRAARMRRLLAAALGELERAPETDTTGVVLVGPSGVMKFASPPRAPVDRAEHGAEASRERLREARRPYAHRRRRVRPGTAGPWPRPRSEAHPHTTRRRPQLGGRALTEASVVALDREGDTSIRTGALATPSPWGKGRFAWWRFETTTQINLRRWWSSRFALYERRMRRLPVFPTET